MLPSGSQGVSGSPAHLGQGLQAESGIRRVDMVLDLCEIEPRSTLTTSSNESSLDGGDGVWIGAGWMSDMCWS